MDMKTQRPAIYSHDHPKRGQRCTESLYLKVCRGINREPERVGKYYEAVSVSFQCMKVSTSVENRLTGIVVTHFIRWRADLGRAWVDEEGEIHFYEQFINNTDSLIDLPPTPHSADGEHQPDGALPLDMDALHELYGGSNLPSSPTTPRRPFYPGTGRAVGGMPHMPSSLKQSTLAGEPSTSRTATPALPPTTAPSASHLAQTPSNSSVVPAGKCNGPIFSNQRDSTKCSKLSHKCTFKFCKKRCFEKQQQLTTPCALNGHRIVEPVRSTSPATARGDVVELWNGPKPLDPIHYEARKQALNRADQAVAISHTQRELEARTFVLARHWPKACIGYFTQSFTAHLIAA